MNQRGQAFSVFELMIAAIVAVAILFVLLPIITNITTPTGDAPTTIGNALSTVSAGTSTDTAPFEVKQNQVINSSLFSEIDPCSVYFDATAFGGKQIEAEADFAIPTGDMECTSRFKNASSAPVKAKAIVFCDTSPNALQSTLDYAGYDSTKLTVLPADFWGTEDPGYSKVCVVILKRA